MRTFGFYTPFTTGCVRLTRNTALLRKTSRRDRVDGGWGAGYSGLRLDAPLLSRKKVNDGYKAQSTSVG